MSKGTDNTMPKGTDNTMPKRKIKKDKQWSTKLYSKD
jgi:hypothetical protein